MEGPGSTARDIVRESPAEERAEARPEAGWVPAQPVRGALRYESASRAIQTVLSAVALILLSPLLAAIAVAIKLSDGGRVLYRGERVGQGRRIFRIYKFRTLKEGAEEGIGARLLEAGDGARYGTLLGRFLKRSKLDELPQLLNVIRGEMRWVGPRPIRPIFLESFEREIANYGARFAVPPGITGIAQLRGGYYTRPREKLRYDLFYKRNRSLLLDLKIVLLTFVKVLNRWLSAGLFLVFLVLFLFVSLVPAGSYSSFYVFPFGVRVGLLYLCIIGAALWVFVRRGPVEFSLYRSPLNAAMLLFLIPAISSVLLAEDAMATLRRGGYYVVTAFFLAFIVVNILSDRKFGEWMARLVALTALAVSAVGLFEVSLIFREMMSPGSSVTGVVRASSTLTDPVSLATYLVLGIPLLLSEVKSARSAGARDFWLVTATICSVTILFTQTRIGFAALLVTGTFFFARRLTHAISFFAAFLLVLAFVGWLGVPRFSVSELRKDVDEWVQRERLVTEIPVTTWLFGGVKPAVLIDGKNDDQDDGVSRQFANMHLTLMLEHGVGAWLVIMGLIASAWRVMRQAHDRATDPRMQSILRAIMASVLGFLVSMNGMNVFHHLTLEIFFWSLVGIGLGIAIQVEGRERHNLIWRFGDAGD